MHSPGDFSREDQKGIHQLIIQNKETDPAAERQRNQWKQIAKLLLYLALGLFILSIDLAYLVGDRKILLGLSLALGLYLYQT
ncbi:MAG: hypothetical protein HC880_00690 [Bacteroidia bacterium]|nr:hypothetical protein [Bacteroidia bacterium]